MTHFSSFFGVKNVTLHFEVKPQTSNFTVRNSNWSFLATVEKSEWDIFPCERGGHTAAPVKKRGTIATAHLRLLFGVNIKKIFELPPPSSVSPSWKALKWWVNKNYQFLKTQVEVNPPISQLLVPSTQKNVEKCPC